MIRILTFTLMLSFFGFEQNQTVKTRNSEKDDWWLWSANWNPNSNQIVAGGTQDTLRVFSTTNNELQRNYPFEGTITKSRWHPTKNKLAISMQGGKSRSSIFNLDTEERIELDSINNFGARAIGWNTTGELLAVGDYDGFLIIYDERGKFISKITTGQKALIGLDWHPTKNLIVAVGDEISLYDFDNHILKNYKDRPEEVLMLCVEWHPAGDLFVTGDYGDYDKNYPPLLQFWTPEGQKIKSVEKSKAEYRNLRWSKKGDLLATASDGIRIWSKSGLLITEKTTEHLLWGIDWDQQAEKIVVTDETGRIMIWDKNSDKLEELAY